MSRVATPLAWCARTRTGIRGERREPKLGWVVAAYPRNHMWAVYYEGRLIGRYGLLTKANDALYMAIVRAKGPARAYKLGKRMESKK